MIPNGRIVITGDIDIILNAPLINQNGCMVKIIDMDDDNNLEKLNNPNIIRGSCLLPPMEAKIAEADGNEQLYDQIYHMHLLDKFQQEFITVLIAFIYKGGDLIIYLPKDDYSYTKEKFIQHFEECYGIRIGIIEENTSIPPLYNQLFVPFWVGLLYLHSIISWRDYLIRVPDDFPFYKDDMIITNKLINDIKPYISNDSEASGYNLRIDYIINFKQKLKHNPNLVPALEPLYM